MELAVGKIGGCGIGARPSLAMRLEQLAPGREVLFFGTFLAVMQLFDGLLTSMGIEKFGIGMEGNPLLRSLMLEFGHVPTLAVVKTLAVAIVIALMVLSNRLPWIKHALGAVAGVYVFAAIIPWTYILLIQPLLAA